MVFYVHVPALLTVAPYNRFKWTYAICQVREIHMHSLFLVLSFSNDGQTDIVYSHVSNCELLSLYLPVYQLYRCIITLKVATCKLESSLKFTSMYECHCTLDFQWHKVQIQHQLHSVLQFWIITINCFLATVEYCQWSCCNDKATASYRPCTLITSRWFFYH